LLWHVVTDISTQQPTSALGESLRLTIVVPAPELCGVRVRQRLGIRPIGQISPLASIDLHGISVVSEEHTRERIRNFVRMAKLLLHLHGVRWRCEPRLQHVRQMSTLASVNLL